MELWNGFEIQKITLAEREAVIVIPKKPNGKWAIKTEYFEAFPDVQIKLLEQGYYIAHIKNKTRWFVPEDNDARAQLVEYMVKTYNVSQKCVIIGMSCGGMQGIYFASKYPQYVSCMYLDAPVVNLLSSPAGVGNADDSAMEEFVHDTSMNLIDLMKYRNHPLDHIPNLIKNNIPIILVCGDSDTVVPYEENGKLLNDEYIKAGIEIKTIIKKGANHHPHGFNDNSEIIKFINEHC